MIYIKLNDDLSLAITVSGTIHAGDNMSQKITYLVPAQVGEIDVAGAYVYLNYVCADGSSDMVKLARSENLYNNTYYQFVTQVTCKLSKYPGEVRTWLSVTTPDTSGCECPKSVSSGECYLHVEGPENSGHCATDSVLIALTQMQAEVDEVKQKQDDIDIHEIVQEELDNYNFDPIIVPLVYNSVQIATEGFDDKYDAIGSASAVYDALSSELGALAAEVASDVQQLQAMINSIERMPAVTAQDNGKFMRVVNARWAADDSIVDVSQEGM